MKPVVCSNKMLMQDVVVSGACNNHLVFKYIV